MDITMDDEFRITQIVQPDGGTWTYEYDEAGDLVSATNPAGNERRYSKIDYMENKLDMVNRVRCLSLLSVFGGELAELLSTEDIMNMMHVQRPEIRDGQR
ncbi:MAG: RHS repeat domain-containing protein [Enterocloster clostridioformis]